MNIVGRWWCLQRQKVEAQPPTPWRQISSNRYKSSNICFHCPCVLKRNLCIKKKSTHYFITLSLSNALFWVHPVKLKSAVFFLPPPLEIRLKICIAGQVPGLCLLKALPLLLSCPPRPSCLLLSVCWCLQETSPSQQGTIYSFVQ